MTSDTFQLSVPFEWYEEVNDDDSYIRIRAPKRTGLSKKQLPKHDFVEETMDGDEYLVCYFFFKNEIEAMHFKLKYF
jgi:hypothetical protein